MWTSIAVYYMANICWMVLASFWYDDFLLYAHQLIGSKIVAFEILVLLLLLFLFIDHSSFGEIVWISFHRHTEKGNMHQQADREITERKPQNIYKCVPVHRIIIIRYVWNILRIVHLIWCLRLWKNFALFYIYNIYVSIRMFYFLFEIKLKFPHNSHSQAIRYWKKEEKWKWKFETLIVFDGRKNKTYVPFTAPPPFGKISSI